MGIVRRYRLVVLTLVVLGVLAGFMGFFLVFLLAPVVPLGLFYLGYLALRERDSRARRRTGHVLAHEAEARRRLLQEESWTRPS